MVAIHRFIGINSLIRPGHELAELQIGDDGDVSTESVRARLESVSRTMDGMAVSSMDSDPLSYPDLFKLLKEIRVPGLEITLISQGSSPSNLDDLVGAGYVAFLNLVLDSPINDDQCKCLDVMRDNGRQFMVSITLGKGVFDEDSLASTCRMFKDAKHVVIRNGKGKDALTQKEMVSMTKPLKGLVKDLRII
jgi:hypothetical protein